MRRDEASHGIAVQRDPRLRKAVVSSHFNRSCSHLHNPPTHHSSSSSSSASFVSSPSCPPPKPAQILSEHSYFRHWTGRDEPPERHHHHHRQQQSRPSQQRVKPPGGCFLTPAEKLPQRSSSLVDSVLCPGSLTKSAAVVVPMRSQSGAPSSPVSVDVSGLNSSVRGPHARAVEHGAAAGVHGVAAGGSDAQVTEKDGAARSEGVAEAEEVDCGPPPPLRVSLDGFSLDLDSEPETSEAADEDEEEEEDEEEVDIELEETSLVVSLPRAGHPRPEPVQSSTDSSKAEKADSVSDRPAKKLPPAPQPELSAKPLPGSQSRVQQSNGPKINGFISLAQFVSHRGSPTSAVQQGGSARTRSMPFLSTARQLQAGESCREVGGGGEEVEEAEAGEAVMTRRSARLQRRQLVHREEELDEPLMEAEVLGSDPASPGAPLEGSDVRGDGGMMEEEEEDVDVCRPGLRGRRKRGRSRRFVVSCTVSVEMHVLAWINKVCVLIGFHVHDDLQQYKKRQKKSSQPAAGMSCAAVSVGSVPCGCLLALLTA